MKTLIYSLFCTVLVHAASIDPVMAAADFPPFTITINPSDREKSLHAPLQKALRKERDRLEQSGITMSGNKLFRRELGILVKVLKSEGFYRHNLAYETSGNSVIYRIETGGLYRINKVFFESSGMDIRLPDPEQLGLHTDMKLRAEAVLAAQDLLHQFIRNNNCLYQTGVSHEVVLHHDAATADVRFLIKPSEQVNINQVAINGLETVEEAYVREKLGLRDGQCYQTRSIEKVRLGLLQTGLFSIVDSQVSPPQQGKVNIRFDLKERNHRTVKAGVGYSTDESISLTAGWQHRNIFGEAELLEIEGKVSGLYKIIDTTLTYPSFRRSDQALILEAELAEENLEAFDSTGMTLTASLKRKLARYWTATVGMQYKFKSVREAGGENTFALMSLPTALGHDNRDNILDPHHGWVSTIEVQPFVDALDTDILFLKTSIGASIYHTFEDIRFAPTLAARTVFGFINGISVDSVPASERFYAGGGGSVRGYPFQKLGPLVNDDPHGGRSLMEVSLEARLRVFKNWGGVIFIDGGNVYPDQFPRIDQGLHWAVGFGARYYTTFAPIRVDIGFPLNRRSGIDDTFQLYISLAQAF